MKTLLISILFFAISNVSTAQLMAYTNTDQTTSTAANDLLFNNEVKASTNTPIKRTRKVVNRDNQSAAIQLSQHLAEQLKYSSLMRDYGLEGKIVIEVTLSNTGEISNTKVIQSPHAHMEDIILKAMEDLKTIATEDNLYYGNKRIRVPVSFSLR